MSLFGNSTLFSPVSGTVLKDGKPVAGAQVLQSARLGAAAPLTQSAVTGEDGHFSFPALERAKGIGGLFPREYVVSQEIKIVHDGQEYIGWIHTKRDPKAGSETGGRDFRLVCDLDQKPDYQDTHYGVCRLE